MHICPVAANTLAITPLAAASRSASAKTTFADFPPSSKVTGATWSAASFITWMPDGVEPVNDTLSTPGCRTSARPVVAPVPVTTLITPSGNPASAVRRISSSADAVVCSAVFTTTVQPAARAGATFIVKIISGPFHGTIAATTPTGSGTEYTK